MVSEQETKKQPPMKVSQIHNLKLLIETISNLIDLYKSNTNQSQNSYQPKNLGVGSKRTAATTTQANNRRRNISLPPNGSHIESAHAPLLENKEKHPKPKKTYVDALVDGGKWVCGGLTPVLVAAPFTDTGENKEGWMTAVIGDHSAAPPVTDSSVGGSSNTGRQQHPSNSEVAAAAAEGATAEAAEGVALAADEAALAAEALQRRRRKKRRMRWILVGGEEQTTVAGARPPPSGSHEYKDMAGKTAGIAKGETAEKEWSKMGFSKNPMSILQISPQSLDKFQNKPHHRNSSQIPPSQF